MNYFVAWQPLEGKDGGISVRDVLFLKDFNKFILGLRAQDY